MTYPLTDEDRALQAKARQFADELIPCEVEAEMHEGELPEERRRRPHRRGRTSWGSTRSTCPKELGGDGYSMLPAGRSSRSRSGG